MKILTLCLALLLGAKLHGAVQDDIARAFLAGVAANPIAPTLVTNATVLTPLGTAVPTFTNVANFSIAGGLVYFDLGSFTNLNGLGTVSNLASVSIPGGTLTNLGDTIRAQWGGVMARTSVNTNQFQITYGGTTLIDTGLQPSSNTTFNAYVMIIRTGNSSQHIEASVRFGPGGGVPFTFTNINAEFAINNGVANVLALAGAARKGGAHTNNSFRIYYEALR